MTRRAWTFPLGVLAAALVLALLSPLASSKPDGLERVVEDHGPAAEHEQAVHRSPMPDYAAPGVGHQSLSVILAGLAGTLAVFAVALAIARLLARGGIAPAEPEDRAHVEGSTGDTPPSP